jgi:hypothetical protein
MKIADFLWPRSRGTGPAVPAGSPDYGKGLAATRAKVSDAIPPITRRRLTLGLPTRVIPAALFSIKSVIKNKAGCHKSQGRAVGSSARSFQNKRYFRTRVPAVDKPLWKTLVPALRARLESWPYAFMPTVAPVHIPDKSTVTRCFDCARQELKELLDSGLHGKAINWALQWGFFDTLTHFEGNELQPANADALYARLPEAARAAPECSPEVDHDLGKQHGAALLHALHRAVKRQDPEAYRRASRVIH